MNLLRFTHYVTLRAYEAWRCSKAVTEVCAVSIATRAPVLKAGFHPSLDGKKAAPVGCEIGQIQAFSPLLGVEPENSTFTFGEK